jgi:predicted transcriptional regulator
MQKKNDTENIRFKIVYSLIKNKKPMKLSEIAKETDLRDHHVLYHLKKLKEEYLVIEVEDKEYVCQPFLIDNIVYEDLKNLMSVIIRIITREIELPDDCSENKRVVSIIKNLEAFIRNYSSEILE